MVAFYSLWTKVHKMQSLLRDQKLLYLIRRYLLMWMSVSFRITTETIFYIDDDCKNQLFIQIDWGYNKFYKKEDE